MRVLSTTFVAMGLGLLLDQVTKALAVASIGQSGPVALLGRLRLRLVANLGAVGGTPMPTWIIGVAVLITVIFGLWWFFRSRTVVLLAFSAFAGGGLGNLLDRMVHRPAFPDHAVVDWISIRGFATFNIADLLIVIGGIGLLVALRGDESSARPS